MSDTPGTRYTPAKRRAVETARQQRVAAQLDARKSMSVDELEESFAAALITRTVDGVRMYRDATGEHPLRELAETEHARIAAAL